MRESSTHDNKSLATITGKTADWDGLAKDAVAFANAKGGTLAIGIEDGQTAPPVGQRVPVEALENVVKKIRERTVNVQAAAQIERTATGDEFLKLDISRATSVASTSDGRYFLRVVDESIPVVGDDVMRLMTDRNAYPWELLTTAQVPSTQADAGKVSALMKALRASDRVTDFAKAKTDDELLAHYHLVDGPTLTNLGILCVGSATDRARLGTAPRIQAIKYDADGQKINKWPWDDSRLSPIELVEDVWKTIPDFREQFELPDGLFRKQVPMFDEAVVRELLVNALVHRPYTQRGDIFLNFHPDRLEVVNPGTFPPGVSARNILHTTVRRNDNLAWLFHDLKLMEREGSGFDKMYEIMLSAGRPVPVAQEGADRVVVTLSRRRPDARIADLITKADQQFQLTQRERICLGLLAQHDGLTAVVLARHLELKAVEEVKHWLGRLGTFGLVHTAGRTKSTRYFIPPEVLARLDFSAKTTLTRIQPHRLRALIEEDLKRYPWSAIGDINRRIGEEVSRATLKRELDGLLEATTLIAQGEKRWKRYAVVGTPYRAKPGISDPAA